MTRDKLLKIKEAALYRMLLCYSVFAGNKPPRPEHAVELEAHCAFYKALCAELGEAYPLSSKLTVDRVLQHAEAVLQIALRDCADRRDCVQSALEYVREARRIGGAS